MEERRIIGERRSEPRADEIGKAQRRAMFSNCEDRKREFAEILAGAEGYTDAERKLAGLLYKGEPAASPLSGWERSAIAALDAQERRLLRSTIENALAERATPVAGERIALISEGPLETAPRLLTASERSRADLERIEYYAPDSLPARWPVTF